MRGVTANGPKILSFRTKLGFTQDDLARAAEIDVKTLRKAEKGNRIDLATLTRLALALGTEVGQIVVEDTPEPSSQGGRDLIVRWNRAWEAEDMEAFLALFTEDAVLTLPGSQNVPFGGTYRGKEEIRRCHEINWATVRMVPITPEELTIMVKGDVITVTGERQAYMPNGELMPLRCVLVFYTRDNLIARQEVFYDTLDFSKKMELPLD